jgi:hypothetical protein
MSTTSSSTWSIWERHLFRFTFLFVGLLLFIYPFHRPYLPDIGSLLRPVTTPVAAWVAAHVLHLAPRYLHEIASDTTLLYVHIGNVAVLAAVGALLWAWRDRKRLAYPRLQYVLRTAARYFLAAALLSYGLVKVFKAQFYLPEPNTLYTPLGEVPRDLLFWSTMGASRTYSIFTGLLEVIAGLLLLWRRTSLVGALLGLAVMGNVLMLNLSFDISVKVYAALLCLLCVVILAPDTRRLWEFFSGKVVQAPTRWVPDWSRGKRKMFYLLGKTLVISALLFDALGLFFETGNFNDDRAPRPRFHGAYAVEEFVSNGDTVPPDVREVKRWRRAFVHRQSFFIIQTMDDHMQDYVLEWDSTARQITFLDPMTASFGQFHYHSTGDTLLDMTGQMNQDTLSIRLKRLDWRKLPLLRNEFHWTSDEL